jgi:hypothetical protein
MRPIVFNAFLGIVAVVLVIAFLFNQQKQLPPANQPQD